MDDDRDPAPGHSHSHDTDLVDPDHQQLAVRIVLAAVATVAVLTIAGLIIWWPRGEAPDTSASIAGLEYPRAVVVDIAQGECPTFEFDHPTDCDLVSAELRTGPAAGSIVTFQVAAIDFDVPPLSIGDRLILQHNPMAPPEFAYTYWEHERDSPLLALLILFVVVVLVFGRWQGARALVGLVVTFGIIVWFLLPSLLRDQPAVAVALVAASLIAFSTLSSIEHPLIFSAMNILNLGCSVSLFNAARLLWCWLLCSRDSPTAPDSLWISLTPESVVFWCCPPEPPDLKVWMVRSFLVTENNSSLLITASFHVF